MPDIKRLEHIAIGILAIAIVVGAVIYHLSAVQSARDQAQLEERTNQAEIRAAGDEAKIHEVRESAEQAKQQADVALAAAKTFQQKADYLAKLASLPKPPVISGVLIDPKTQRPMPDSPGAGLTLDEHEVDQLNTVLTGCKKDGLDLTACHAERDLLRDKEIAKDAIIKDQKSALNGGTTRQKMKRAGKCILFAGIGAGIGSLLHGATGAAVGGGSGGAICAIK